MIKKDTSRHSSVKPAGVPAMPLFQSSLQKSRPSHGAPFASAADGSELEHRQFPRAELAVPVELWIGEGKERTFSATLKSSNVSVSGMFLDSSFFLALGTELSLRFGVGQGNDRVLGKGEVVREARSDSGSGMGVRFVTFEGQSEVTLARLFLGDALREFAEEYLATARAKSLKGEFERVVDALAAWELLRVTRPGDPWRQGIPTAPPVKRGKGR